MHVESRGYSMLRTRANVCMVVNVVSARNWETFEFRYAVYANVVWYRVDVGFHVPTRVTTWLFWPHVYPVESTWNHRRGLEAFPTFFELIDNFTSKVEMSPSSNFGTSGSGRSGIPGAGKTGWKGKHTMWLVEDQLSKPVKHYRLIISKTKITKHKNQERPRKVTEILSIQQLWNNLIAISQQRCHDTNFQITHRSSWRQ